MKRKILLSFCLSLLLGNSLVFSPAYANVEQRRSELISILDEELREVTRLNKQVEGKRPDLLLRMAQVLLEKGRLLKDQENQKFLEIPSAERAKTNRGEFFKESRRYFDQAQKTVLTLLKRFKNFDEKADAYYILAYNAKELGQEEQSRKYFQRALDESRGNSLIADKSRIALAEIYFNKGSFDKALKLYEPAIKNKRDKWWTKDAFNLSWSYFKVGQHDKAIRLMTESYELSKSKKYIDMSTQIERDLAVFYTEAGRSEEAIRFYEKNGKNISDVLLKVGRHLKRQSKFTQAEKTLEDALKSSKDDKEKVEIQIELIDLFEKFGREKKHLEVSRLLTDNYSKGNLSESQVTTLRFNLEKMSAIIQQHIVNKTYASQPKLLNEKVNLANEYFMMSARANPEKAQTAYFHSGETYFSVDQFDKAVPLYAEAIKRAQANKDKKTESLASNAMMVALSKNVSKKTQDDYLVPAYEGFLSVNPKGEKSGVIYQRLFSTLMDKKDVPGAEGVLMRYKENFPRESETQEKMLAQIMDYHKDKGDKAALANWATKVESGEFKVNPEYAQKVKTLVLGMQFEKVEKANVSGDKRGALRGYLDIYKSPETDAEAKKTAAYNVAVIFYETGTWKQMYAWAQRALSMMGPKDIGNFEKNYILFTTDLFQRRQFEESASLSDKSFEKLCRSNSKSIGIFFKNANVIYLANGQFEQSMALLNKAASCGVSSAEVMAGYMDHLNELALANRWGSFNEVITKLEASKEMWPSLIYPSSLLANELETIGRSEDADKVRKKILTYFETAKKSKMSTPLEGLDVVAELKMEGLVNQIRRFNATKLAFPEANYNKLLKSKFEMLNKISSEAVVIAEIGSGVGVVKAYKYLVEAHEDFMNEVLRFVPEGKSEDYVASFQKSMKSVAAPLEKQAKDFRDSAISKIEKDNILSEYNSWFLVKNDQIIPEYYPQRGSVIMDKAGIK